MKKTKKINPNKLVLIQKSNLAKETIKMKIAQAKTQEEAISAACLTVNQVLVSMYEEETKSSGFKLFKEWKELGFKVKAKSKGFAIWARPKKGAEKVEVTRVDTGESEEKEFNYEFFPMCYLFHEGQVEKFESSKELTV